MDLAYLGLLGALATFWYIAVVLYGKWGDTDPTSQDRPDGWRERPALTLVERPGFERPYDQDEAS